MLLALRYRFWVDAIVSLLTGTLAIVTLFWRDWIEAVVRIDPDKGSGSSEWLVVLGLLIITVTLAGGARLEWRRARLALSAEPCCGLLDLQ
jgi:hypothetical protein